MPTHQKHCLKNETYFVTFTCHDWIPLFQITNIYFYFNKWFNYLIEQKAYLLGYVIMPNHFHGLIYVPDECTKDLNLLVGNGKDFSVMRLSDVLMSLVTHNSSAD